MGDADDEYCDLAFSQLASKLGGVEPLLDAMFGFLSRRTDFYIEFDRSVSPQATMGFPSGAAERMVQRAFAKFPFKAYESMGTAVPCGDGKGDSKAVAAAIPPAAQTLFQLTPEGKQVPLGNGGIGPNYYWTQTLQDATMYFDVAEGTRGKDVKCEIRATDIHLGVISKKSQQEHIVLVSGRFEDPVRQDESMWTINISPTGSQIVITLEKTRKTWWKHAIVGHPEIDTNNVDSTTRISDYDESTQATIRKIMAEQQQKRAT